jgi:hypothetical protein
MNIGEKGSVMAASSRLIKRLLGRLFLVELAQLRWGTRIDTLKSIDKEDVHGTHHKKSLIDAF